MINRFAAVAFAAAASLSFAAAAQAEDIPATPMNHGPMMMHGMGPMGDLFNLGMTPVNMVGKPVLDATGAVVGAMPMAAAEPMAAGPMMHHRHHHMMMHKKTMMHKKMMMKKAM